MSSAPIRVPNAVIPITDRTGLVGLVYRAFFAALSVGTPTTGSVAAQPILTSGDAGVLYRVAAVNHLMAWDGAAWQFADGDHPLKVEMFSTNPGTGWQLCDGTATTVLTPGPTLTLSAVTTPNLIGSSAYFIQMAGVGFQPYLRR